MTEKAELPRVVYITGTGRSGSTLLDILLAGHHGQFGQRLPFTGHLWDVISRLFVFYYISRPWRQAMKRRGDLSLVQPEITANTNIETIEIDILVPPDHLRKEFTVARVCNFLNRKLFTERAIETALQNAANFLNYDGLLLEAWNHGRAAGEDQRGTLIHRTSDSLEIVDRHGGSSRFEDIVLRPNITFAPTARHATS